MMLAPGTDIIGCDRQGALSTERADYLRRDELDQALVRGELEP